ncbi:MAG: SMP-30/gluconolactonase/LRE family protein [Thermocrispum sp.]
MTAKLRRLALPIAALLMLALAPSAAAHRGFPATIGLPDGFQPEGIAIGKRPVAYLGSLADGSIYRADLRNGRGKIISRGPGTPSVGLKVDHRGKVYVAGGPAGNARVVDTRTGRVLATHQLASGESFVNDVVLTPRGAWFTDSVNPVLYLVPRNGSPRSVPLTGDLVYQEGFNVNGIARTPDGKGLLVVQTNTGKLFRVEPRTGFTHEVDVNATLTNGDGLLLRGRTLYVVQNRDNVVTVLRLDRAGDRARVVDRITDPRFDVPTTVARFGDRLYLPNARFGTPPEPTTKYQVVAVRAH